MAHLAGQNLRFFTGCTQASNKTEKQTYPGVYICMLMHPVMFDS